MGKPCGPEQASGDDIVDKVCNSDQSGAGEQRKAAAHELVPHSLGLNPRRYWRVVVGRIADPCFAYESHRDSPAPTEKLEQREVHNRKQRGFARPWKVVERLLLETERKAHRIRHWDLAHTIFQTSVDRTHIRK